MPTITFDNGVIDVSSLVYGSAAAIMALAALIGVCVVLKRRKSALIQKRRRALQASEPAIRALYETLHTYTDPDHFGAWRTDYIRIAEQKFGPDIWGTCLEKNIIPPLDVKNGELITT